MLKFETTKIINRRPNISDYECMHNNIYFLNVLSRRIYLKHITVLTASIQKLVIFLKVYIFTANLKKTKHNETDFTDFHCVFS